MTPRAWPWSSRAPVGPGAHFRAAVDAASEWSVADASRIAREWATWAITEAGGEAGDPAGVREAAEAHWRLVTQVPYEMQRRHDAAERRRIAVDVQGTAAEAGFWLSRDGRVRDAVVAVELARAISLTQTAGRLPDDVDRRLARVGAAHLGEEHARALEEFRRCENDSYAAGSRRGPARGPAPTGLLTPGQQAWSILQQRRHDILEVLGLTEKALLPDFEHVRRAAVGSPIVYLAATGHGGYGLLVRAAGDPVAVPLPELTVEALTTWIDAFRDLVRPTDLPVAAPAWDALLEWLGAAIMQPLVERLEEGDDLVVVALGALALLPLHAAVVTDREGARANVCDRFPVRGAPNARLLAAARRGAQEQAYRRRKALVVSAGEVADHAVLPMTGIETAGVTALYGDDAEPVSEATPDELMRRLPQFDVWHFACHGVAVVDDPLQSGLVLSGGALLLADILAVPHGSHRLAVLSACETAIPDKDRLDESIGFPGALLRAGVSGVVATQWLVDDGAAAFLSLRFHGLWNGGQEPWRALNESQCWLRDATQAQLLDLLEPSAAATYLGECGVTLPAPASWLLRRPFSHPSSWAAFTYTGG